MNIITISVRNVDARSSVMCTFPKTCVNKPFGPAQPSDMRRLVHRIITNLDPKHFEVHCPLIPTDSL